MMKRNYRWGYIEPHSFCFGGLHSRDYGLYLTDVKIENMAEREITRTSILGRSGDIVYDNGRYKNVDVIYNVAIVSDFEQRFRALKNDMLSLRGYQRLTNTIHLDEYRMAVFHGGVKPFNMSFNRMGQFELVFNCKPQRFLSSGDQKHLLESPSSLYNETANTALPVIYVYGDGPGSLTVGDTTVQIKAIDGHLILDSDIQNAYRRGLGGVLENKNKDIYAPVFPRLNPGKVPVSWTGRISKVEIIPRWWTT